MLINNSTLPAIYRWRPACWLRVTGEDAANFLQGQFSNDLRPLPQAGAVYGLWLTLKGKVLADSFVLRGGPHEFWIGSYFSPADVIRQRIESHVIADDVVVEDATDSWAGLSVLGPDSAGIGGPGSTATSFTFPGRRDRGPNIERVYRTADGEPEWITAVASSGTVTLEQEGMERRRIGAGIPAIPRDAGPADLPNEAGLDAEAISYTKGCYLGQEVMARLKSMGKVRRRLLRVGGSGESVPSLPAPVFVETRQVGEVRSAVRYGSGGWIGLAMITRMHVTAEAELSLTAGGARVIRMLEAP